MKLFTTTSYKKSHNTLYISEINSWWIMSLNILMILSSTMVKWILSSGRPVLVMKSKTFLLYFCWQCFPFSFRFEMPYNIWCGGCGNHIGMGECNILHDSISDIYCGALNFCRRKTTSKFKMCVGSASMIPRGQVLVPIPPPSSPPTLGASTEYCVLAWLAAPSEFSINGGISYPRCTLQCWEEESW